MRINEWTNECYSNHSRGQPQRFSMLCCSRWNSIKHDRSKQRWFQSDKHSWVLQKMQFRNTPPQSYGAVTIKETRGKCEAELSTWDNAGLWSPASRANRTQHHRLCTSCGCMIRHSSLLWAPRTSGKALFHLQWLKHKRYCSYFYHGLEQNHFICSPKRNQCPEPGWPVTWFP